MKKIVFIAPEFYPVNGGVANAVYIFAAALVKQGYKLWIITPQYTQKDARYENYNNIKILRIPRIPIKGIRYLSFVMYSIYLIRKIMPDLVFGIMVWHGGTISALASILFGIKSATQAHGSDVDELYFPGLKLLTKFSLKYNSYVFSTNTEFKNKLLLLYNRKINLLRNIIQTDYTNFSKEEYRQKVNFKKDKFYLLSIGRLVKINNIETKGISYVLKAMHSLKGCKLIVLGDGSLKDVFEKYIIKNKLDSQICLMGKVPKHKVIDYMRASDCLIFPSLTEGLSMVLLEAMTNKLPVITTKVGGSADIILDEYNGLFIDKKSIQSIIQAVNKLKNNTLLQEKISKNGMTTCITLFNETRIITDFEEAIGWK